MSAMRLSLWADCLLTTVVYSRNRQQNRVRIFETGLRFVRIYKPIWVFDRI